MSEIMETLEDPDAVVEGAAPEGADADADRVTKLQGLAITVCPKITAVFSMVGSACLIYLTLRDLLQHARLSKHEQQRNTSGRAPPPRSRNSSAAPPTSGRAGEAAGGGKRVLTNPTYARFVLGLSLGDFVASTAWFLTTWPIPKDTPEIYGIYWNIGNQATCSIQGFFTQFSFVAVAYNLNLALYYVLVVVYSWKHEQLLRVEPYCHGWALLFSVGSASVMAYLGMYNQAIWDCWIAPQPLGCQESWDYDPTSSSTTAVAPNCVRGDNASLFRFIFYYGPLWIVIVAIIVLMIILVRYVQSIERKVATHRHGLHEQQSLSFKVLHRPWTLVRKLGNRRQPPPPPPPPPPIRASVFDSTRRRNLRKLKHSSAILRQALFYCGAFIFTWIFSTIFQITFLVLDHEVIYALLFLTAFIIPIQGALNLIVYLRPKFIVYLAAQRQQQQQQQKKNKTHVSSSSCDESLKSNNNNGVDDDNDSSQQQQQQQQQQQNKKKWYYHHCNYRVCEELFVVTAIIAWFHVLGTELGLIHDDDDRKKDDGGDTANTGITKTRRRTNPSYIGANLSNINSSQTNNNNNNDDDDEDTDADDLVLTDRLSNHMPMSIIEDNSIEEDEEEEEDCSDDSRSHSDIDIDIELSLDDHDEKGLKRGIVGGNDNHEYQVDLNG